MNVPQVAPINPRATRRTSSDDAWPLRRADGRPWHATQKKEESNDVPHRA